MIQETVRKIEERLRGIPTLSKQSQAELFELVATLKEEMQQERLRGNPMLPEQSRAELLQLLATLKVEMQQFSATHEEEAQSITRFTELSTHEATRAGKNPRLMELSLQGLAASVDGFESSHPKLVQVVNRICTTLSNLGV